MEEVTPMVFVMSGVVFVLVALIFWYLVFSRHDPEFEFDIGDLEDEAKRTFARTDEVSPEKVRELLPLAGEEDGA